MTIFPTADDVAAAIICASRETGCDPIAVAEGATSAGRDREEFFAISRARVYAALALDKVFNGDELVVARSAVARMVGVLERATQDSYFAAFEQRRASCKWWRDSTLRRVIAAVVDCAPMATGEK